MELKWQPDWELVMEESNKESVLKEINWELIPEESN